MTKNYRKHRIFKNLLLLFGLITLYFLSLSNVLAQSSTEVSASLTCESQTTILKGESADLTLKMSGTAPFTIQYSDGKKTHTIQTSETALQLQVSPESTTTYQLVSMRDSQKSGQVCGEATIAVKGSTSSKKDPDCLDNCFETEILEIVDKGDCKEITLKVSTDGDCNYALSHFNVAQGCGTIQSASNSLGNKMEWNKTDPTTQIKGLKVDNISGFGDKGYQEFTVTYTICNDGSCGDDWLNSNLLVTYKAGQCVYYDDLGPIQETNPLVADLATTDITCFEENDGTATLTVIGGEEPYIINWSNGAQNSFAIQDLSEGSYSVTITDQSGQTITLPFEITSPEALSLNLQVSQASCEDGESGRITALISGGTAPYSYDWSNGGTFASIQDIESGVYEVTVTDANGCQVSGTIEYTGPVPFSATLTYDACEGIISSQISGGNAPYVYQWSNNTGNSATAVSQTGNYSVTITDAEGCTTTASIEISQIAEPLIADFLTTPLDCSGENNGSIEAVVANGTGPFTYAWSNGSTTSMIENLAPGTYNLTITDALGCTLELSQTLSDPGQLDADIQISTEGCGPEALSMVEIAVQGDGNYQIIWNDGYEGTNRERLSSGNYKVTISDGQGCAIEKSFNIAPREALSLNLTYDPCVGGLIQPSVNGGFGDYTYLWSTGENTSSITVSEIGTYSVTIIDESGCAISAEVTVSEIFEKLDATANITNVSCFGGNDGKIQLNISGADQANVTWAHGATGSNLEGLSAGIYTATILNPTTGCEIVKNFQVRQPNALRVTGLISPLTCADENAGAIRLVIDFGTAPYSYAWSNGETTKDIDSLSTGTYTIVVTDAKGCQITESFTIQPAPVFSATLNFDNCSNTLMVSTSGGSGPYSYLWGDNSTDSQLVVSENGTYNVTVTDAQGCTADASLVIDNLKAPLSLTGTVTDASCENSKDGGIRIVASGGTSPYSIRWSNGSTSPHQSNLASGTYTAILTDSNGCTVEETFVVGVLSDLEVQAVITQPSCDNNFGSIILNISGGSGEYEIVWSNGSTDDVLADLEGGQFSVTVTDGSGCAITRSYSIVIAECEDEDDNSEDPNNGEDEEGENSDDDDNNDGEDSDNNEDGDDNDEDGDGNNDGDGDDNDQGDGDDNDGGSDGGPIGGDNGDDDGDDPSNGDDNDDDNEDGDGNDGDGNDDSDSGNGNDEGDQDGNDDGNGDQNDDGEDSEEDDEFTKPFVPLCQDQAICLGEKTYINIMLPNTQEWTIQYAENNVIKQVKGAGIAYTLEVSPSVYTTYTLISASQDDHIFSLGNQKVIVAVNECEQAKLAACVDNCFEVNVISATTSGNCITYELEVYADGTCTRELSHFNVAIGNGTVSNVSNSGKWKVEMNSLDPTTGVYGFKVDNISGFGKKGQKQTFTVTYTVCFDTQEEAEEICAPLVAYKAGQCVYYDLAGDYPYNLNTSTTSETLNLYPNPTSVGNTVTVDLKAFEGMTVDLSLESLSGMKLIQKNIQVSVFDNQFKLELGNTPSGIYIVNVKSSQLQQSTKLMIQ